MKPTAIPPEIVILEELLAAEPGHVSGTALAKKIGVSRVSIWQYMEKLREQGFGFEAVSARGYRLTSKPAALNSALIHAYRHGLAGDFTLQLFDEIDSTNDEAARQLATGRETPFAIIARRQTKGRGRFGRVWHSEANGNLYISFAFRPRLEPARMQMFTLWMGANICELTANFCRTVPGLKWPNDILFDGRKAGGMLTEARMDADHIRDLVFGLGLNINSPAGGWPRELADKAVSISEHTHHTLDLNRFTAALIGRVLQAYDRFVDGSYKKTFADLWNRYDVLRGRPVAVLTGTQRVAGTALGIDDEGSFMIRTDKGRTERFHAGEVTLEKKA
ncbi:MAG TPA: biotin--[acetyl-CoA-carboxylase] ligase [Rariglobus sp.]|jgi:BirA family biotin operon repressor/biotin-[acetyl-CoA-carboxylase] ligase|nr:biotin--[acetyl-CoA-carboxylase] ligase [Rariglobus sp.]